MKKFAIKGLVLVFMSLFCVNAYSATVGITFSDPQAVVGNETEVTMKLQSPDGKLSRCDITLAYDTEHLEFISGTDAEGGAGTVRVHGSSSTGTTDTLSYTLKFKALAAGNGAVKIASQEVYDTDESMCEITHDGSSNVTIQAEKLLDSYEKGLQALLVSPGKLSPDFSNDVTFYTVNVGLETDTLAVNAVPLGQGTVSVEGNTALVEGENTCLVKVSEPDGTESVYTITVNKTENGENADDLQDYTVNEGVKLSSKEKSIAILSPGSDVEIPDGFIESAIDIDGHQVKGWVSEGDSSKTSCFVYGMNDSGAAGFYRYDLEDKTLQRYFEDPVSAKIKREASDYDELVAEYDMLVDQYNHILILSAVFGIMMVVLFVLLVIQYLHQKNNIKSDSTDMIQSVSKGHQEQNNGDIKIRENFSEKANRSETDINTVKRFFDNFSHADNVEDTIVMKDMGDSDDLKESGYLKEDGKMEDTDDDFPEVEEL